MCARTCACARARVAVVRERSRRGGGGDARSPRPPSEDPCLALPLAAHGGRRLSFPLSLSSVHSRCLPHRTASGPRVCPLFPVRLFRVPFRFWGVVRVRFPPSGGKGSRPASASRRPLAVAPGRASPDGAGVVRGSRGRARRRGGGAPLPRLPPPTPVRVPSYRVPARRFKDPRGGRLSVPGVGGTEGPVGSRRRPAAPADSRPSRGGWPFPRRAAAVGVREPPLGRPWGSPPRARFAGASSVAGPVSVCPDPLS